MTKNSGYLFKNFQNHEKTDERRKSNMMPVSKQIAVCGYTQCRRSKSRMAENADSSKEDWVQWRSLILTNPEQ